MKLWLKEKIWMCQALARIGSKKARGENSSDIMVSLYKGYKVNDRRFRYYMAKKINESDEGVINEKGS